jgi:ssDNA-binding replication factor A large subunit
VNEDAEKIIKKIVEETGTPEEEVRKKIQEKIKTFAGLLTEVGAAYAVAKEMGVDIDVQRELSRRVKIKDLKPGMERIDVVGRVTRIFPPATYETEKGKGKYCRIIIEDNTGSVSVTLWNRDVDTWKRARYSWAT